MTKKAKQTKKTAKAAKKTKRVNTGYMARIDELSQENKYTSRQIAEIVAKEFGKDLISAKKVVRARIKRNRDAGKKVRVLLEADIREKKPAKTRRSRPRATKSTKKGGKVKTAAKDAKTKEKGKKRAKKAKRCMARIDEDLTNESPADYAGSISEIEKL
jgi:hypothetical protein